MNEKKPIVFVKPPEAPPGKPLPRAAPPGAPIRLQPPGRPAIKRPIIPPPPPPPPKEAPPKSPPASSAKAAMEKKLSHLFYSARYKPLDLVGRGVRGPVYRARDTVLDMEVAMKFLPDSVARNPESVRLFKHEASMALGLSHENIVRLHNLEVEHGRIFLVMEFVQGRNFRQIVQELGRLSLKTVLSIAASCASALEYAHRKGVLHRDLKPENLMLNQENVLKIVDFGTAMPIAIETAGTSAEYVEGTPGYMSPEEARGEPLDRRTDIFSLGAALAEMLTGSPVFPVGEPIARIAQMDPAPMRETPPEVEQVFRRAMARNRAERWSRAGDFYEALLLAIGEAPAKT